MTIYQNQITICIQDAVKEICNDREEWLLKFFGSYEAAEKYGQLFVLETEAVELLPDELNVYRIEERNTIRPKTYLELHDEGLIPLCVEAEKDPLFKKIGQSKEVTNEHS